MTRQRVGSVTASIREAGESIIAIARDVGVSPLALVSLALGLTALLGLGWRGSPLRLHAPGTAVWAAIAASFAYGELRRAPHDSDRRFIATAAVAIAAIALVEAIVTMLSFVPCGGRCM
jgi:hypothetical protein